MKLLILGDIGSDVGFHAGDEAMAEALVAEISKRGDVSVTAISGCVEDTRARYGWDAVPRLGFGGLAGNRVACEERLAALEAAAKGVSNSLPWDDPAWEVINAVSGADAVVVTGGGNLSSTWPEHIYERVAVALLSEVFAKPLVVSGQTLGPHLLGRDSDLVSRLLHAARTVGVREAASLELLDRLGGPLDRSNLTIDDATYLPGVSPSWTPPRAPFIAATFAPSSGILGTEIYRDQIVEVLQRAIEITDCDVVLISHQGGEVGKASSDLEFHQGIAQAVTGDRVHQAPIMTAAEIASLTRKASLVLSSRYHPIVFGLSGSVPSVGIGVDAYTGTKIKGAMCNYGVGSLYVGPASFAQGGGVDAVAEAWVRSSEVVEFLDNANLLRKEDSTRWWDNVYSVLAEDLSPLPLRLSSLEALNDNGKADQDARLDRWSDQLVTRWATQELGFSETQRTLATAEFRIGDLEMQLASVQAALKDARAECALLQDSAAAAQRLAGDLLAPTVQAMADAAAAIAGGAPEVARRLAATERELASLHQTRILRFSRRPRALYSRMRRS